MALEITLNLLYDDVEGRLARGSLLLGLELYLYSCEQPSLTFYFLRKSRLLDDGKIFILCGYSSVVER